MSAHALSRCKPLLGTFVEVTLISDCSDSTLLSLSEQAFTEIERVQKQLSFHDADSELSRLNRWMLQSGDGDFPVSNDLQSVLGLAQELNRLSGGIYDVCIAEALVSRKLLPDHLNIASRELGSGKAFQMNEGRVTVDRPLCIDLGGIAKGYAVDRAFDLMPDDVQVVINAGGDMRMSQWQGQSIGVQFAAPNWARRSAPMLAQAVASSGHYYRKAIVDPITGKPSRRGGSVSVFADTAMLADALTKVVWLLPDDKATHILRHCNAQAIRVGRFGRLKSLT